MSLHRLRCNALLEPAGVDPERIRLTWNDLAEGSPWQVELRDAGDAVVWDSGPQRSVGPACPPPLAPSRIYRWRVRDLTSGSWSHSARFITGLAAADWHAHWIGAEVAPRLRPAWPALHAIAAPGEPLGDLGESFYRLSFTVADPAQVVWAQLRLVSGNGSAVHLNGRLIKRCVHWVGAYDLDLAHHLKAGRNTLAIHTTDKQHGTTALAAHLMLETANGQRHSWSTASDPWRITTRQAPSEWSQVWFDDRAWPLAQPSTAALPDKRPSDGPAPIQLRTTCTLPAALREAVVHVACLGVVELRINGRLLSDSRMDGGWTDCTQRVEARSFDATPALRVGSNEILLTLAGGWWQLHGDQGTPPLQTCLELSWVDVTGAEGRLASDAGWQARAAPIAMSQLYHGEIVDAADLPWGPAMAGDWQALRCNARAEPIAEIERLAPVCVQATRYGSHLVDFGQNISGFVELRGSFTDRVTVAYSELLGGDGLPLRDNLRSARQINIYHLHAQRPALLRPSFALHGFRWVEIFGWQGGVADLTAVVVHTRLEETGGFACSEPLLERIYQATRWTFRDNFHAVPSDCPQRDERLGWMADAGNVPDVVPLFFGIERYFDKWVTDMGDAQRRSGYFPNFAPDVTGAGYGTSRGAPGWADAGVRVPWALYQFYGDHERLAEHYPAMRRHLETLIADSADDLFERGGWGDWLAVEATPGEPIGSAYFHDSARLVAAAADVLGHHDDAARYRAQQARTATAFHARHFNAQLGCYGAGTQTMQAMPLALGMVPATERERVLRHLVADLAAHEDHLTTGFLGTTFLAQALADHGQHDLLLRVLTRRDYPSHGRILDLGSTTITEAWNAHLGIDFASHNHFNLGSVCTWFVNHLGGITGATPGMRSLRLAPAFPHGLDRVEARLLIPAGWVRSAWRRSGDGIDLDLELPVPAALHLPPGWRLRSPSGDTLAPGRHRLGLESGATPTA